MKSPARILLGDDGTRVTATAREAAINLARHWNAELHVAMSHTVVARHFVAAMSELALRCRSEGISLSIHHLAGDPAHELCSAAARLKVDLLIVGSHHRYEGHSSGGSVSRSALLHADVPILIARDGAWPPTHIVVGDDGSAEARAAMDLSGDIGSAFDAHAVIVDALPELRNPGHDPALVALKNGIVEDESSRVANDVSEMREHLDGPAVGLLSYDTPEIAIRNNAADSGLEGHALIAVGSSGKTDFDRHMGWSVSARSVEIETASVLVVPRVWALKQDGDRQPYVELQGGATYAALKT